MRVAPADHHEARHRRLRDALRSASLDALFITSLPNIADLTGLFASAGALVVSQESTRLIIDGRYAEAAEQRRRDVPGLGISVVAASGSYEESSAAELARLGLVTVGFEAGHMTVRQHVDLVRRLAAAGTGIDLVQAPPVVETLRSVKDAWELVDPPGRGRATFRCR